MTKSKAIMQIFITTSFYLKTFAISLQQTTKKYFHTKNYKIKTNEKNRSNHQTFEI